MRTLTFLLDMLSHNTSKYILRLCETKNKKKFFFLIFCVSRNDP